MAAYYGLLLLISCQTLVASAAHNRTVLLAGATGKSGVPAYADLKRLPGITVRALVRNVTKAQALLGCNLCDESEGIFVGDVTKPETLAAAVKGADAVVSTLGSDDVHCKFGPFDCAYPKGAAPKDINWLGTKALATALAKAGGTQVVLLSTMGTTHPDNFLDKLGHGHVSFYSLQAETWLEGSGLDFTIVKACGLGDGEASKHQLIVGHDDGDINLALYHSVTRSDVARVLAAAVASPEDANGLRFDFCSSPFGKATVDAKDVFRKALYPWDPRSQAVEIDSTVV